MSFQAIRHYVSLSINIQEGKNHYQVVKLIDPIFTRLKKKCFYAAHMGGLSIKQFYYVKIGFSTLNKIYVVFHGENDKKFPNSHVILNKVLESRSLLYSVLS